jgi:hypothetical protein
MLKIWEDSITSYIGHTSCSKPILDLIKMNADESVQLSTYFMWSSGTLYSSAPENSVNAIHDARIKIKISVPSKIPRLPLNVLDTCPFEHFYKRQNNRETWQHKYPYANEGDTHQPMPSSRKRGSILNYLRIWTTLPFMSLVDNPLS